MNTQKAIAANVDVDFIQELVNDGASDEAIRRLTNDEQAYYLKLKRDIDMAAKKKTASKKKATKKTASKKVAAKKVAAKKTTANPDAPVSKMEIAVKIFGQDYPMKARKDIILRFMEEAGLTKAGAATYFQNIKKKFEDES